MEHPRDSNVTFKQRLASLWLALKWTYKSSPFLTISVIIIMIFGGLLALAGPYFFKVIIDLLTSEQQISNILGFSLGIVGVLIIYGGVNVFESIFWDFQTVIKKVHGQKLDQYAASQLMDKVSSLDLAHFENPVYYDTLQKSNQNLWRIQGFFWDFTFFLAEFVSVLVILVALSTFNLWIVILILSAAVPSIFFMFKKTNLEWGIFDSYSPTSRQANYYKDLMTSRPEAIKEIQLFGLRTHFIDKFNSLFGGFIKKQEKVARYEALQLVFIGLLEGFFAVWAAYLVLKSFLNGEISLGEFSFYWALLFQFSGHARRGIRILNSFNEASVFLSPFVRLFSFKPDIKESENAIEFPKKLVKGIEFRNVSFKYAGAEKYSLEGVNLVIKPKESVAFVGENGSGKTTLIKLLLRLYDVSSGEILIEGVNIKEYSLESLRKNIGVIFQDFMKYEGMIKENIGYGNLEGSENKKGIHSSAVKSGAWEFISSLESKYQTHLGRTLKAEGKELSGGQWQKIALSRAFFKDAPILILDEPTAAVDAGAEYELFKKFEDLTKDKITILVSHRFSTVRMANHIIVLSNGKIIEEGNHRDLLRKRGLYSRLFMMQAEGYK